MKFILLAVWITALHAYPELSPECKGEGLCGQRNEFSGYPPRQQKNKSQTDPVDIYQKLPEGCDMSNSLKSCGTSNSPARKDSGESTWNIPKRINGLESGETGSKNKFSSMRNVESEQKKSEIKTHIYFHAPPLEPEAESRKTQKSSTTRYKHYNIIFIDTSRIQNSPRQSLPIAANQNEEKTIVYVLVKKTSEEEAIASKAASKPPNKPEVYFINYKEQVGSMRKTESKTLQQPKQEGGAPYPPKMNREPGLL